MIKVPVFRSLSCRAQQNLLNAFKCGELCDAILCTEDKEYIQVHRCILAASSRFFSVLFNELFIERKCSVYTLGGVEGPILRWIVEWTYTNISDYLSHDNAHDIIVSADYLDIPNLVEQCSWYIFENVALDNVIEEYTFSTFYHLCSLRKLILSFIVENLKAISISCREFWDLPLEDMLIIISSDEISMVELDIFDIVISWIAHNEIERRQWLSRLLEEIRLPLIPERYLLTVVRHQSYVLQDTNCLEKVDAAFLLRRKIHSYGFINPLLKAAIPRLPNTIVFAVGGWEKQSQTDVIEVFIPGMNYWLKVDDGNPLSKRSYYATAVFNNYVYFIGGYDDTILSSCYCYNTVTREWKELAPMYQERCYCSSAIVGNYIYVMGGYDGVRRKKSAERYDPQSNQWKLISHMHSKRSDAAATNVAGKIYIFGGFDGLDVLRSAEVYDPEIDAWLVLPEMRSRRSGLSCLVVGDYVYAIGGYDGMYRLSSVERYNPNRQTWEAVPRMITARSNFGADVVDGQILVAGGYSEHTTIANAEMFCHEHMNWVPVRSMAHPRSAIKLVSVTGLSNIRNYAEEARKKVYGIQHNNAQKSPS